MSSINWQPLIVAAREAAARAYCPYSKFAVGAAVLASDGRIDSGCNVENASYGLTICAERNALFQMAARGGREVLALVIYTPTPEPTAPCGACRQVLREFAAGSCPVLCVCAGSGQLLRSLVELLPDSFGPESLG